MPGIRRRAAGSEYRSRGGRTRGYAAHACHHAGASHRPRLPHGCYSGDRGAAWPAGHRGRGAVDRIDVPGTQERFIRGLRLFSAHPLKNLNAMGDAGFVTTNDSAAAARMRRLRTHGMADRETVEEWGFVSRMGLLQAAVLDYRLDKLPDVIAKRRENAALYQSLIKHERDRKSTRPEPQSHSFISY